MKRVTVYNDNGTNTYLTNAKDVFYNYHMGNMSVVMFETISGAIISLPPEKVIIEVEDIKEGENENKN